LRLQIEVDDNGKELDREVVLLEAESEDALRITHRRYFEDLRQMLENNGGRVGQKASKTICRGHSQVLACA